MKLSSWTASLAANALAGPVERYITSHRDHLAISATPLAESAKRLLLPYFLAADLDRVLLLHADPLPIANPPLYPLLKRLRLDLPEPQLAAAITLDSVIAFREAISPQVLFHELIHAVQFRILGIPDFSRLYIKGFLSGGSYELIPLEVCAFQLQARFATERKPFDVAAVVSDWARGGLF